jgi:hypothetical protein
MSKLDAGEINALLDLLERDVQLQALTDRTFIGFSRGERARRLQVRCESDMFVCLRNIFSSDKFDDIVLREFAELDHPPQEVYRAVAAMETAGVRVHRQLVVRMLGIPAGAIAALLVQLEDIVQEYTVDDNKGIYGWKGRHPVITGIITNHKYDDPESYKQLLTRVVENLVPTYEIEQRTIRELCNIDGLSRLPNRAAQNELLSRIISKAPGERVPRHRLIRNLIDDHKFEDAETEVRLFENDFGVDAPVQRYKVLLLKERALYTQGIMNEDRLALLNRAISLAEEGVSRFPNQAPMLRAYADVGLEFYKKTKNTIAFDRAIRAMKEAESRVDDPEITRAIAQYERRVTGHDLAD